MPRQNIAVIGGGAKAAAIAAKAYCLRRVGIQVHVTIFEKHAVGAAWNGRHGYTDGEQRLCTPAERDLGFPYAIGFAGSIAGRMQSDFSWQAYKLAGTAGRSGYADWVNRGRKPPTHQEFADYLHFAVQKSGAPVHLGEVTKIRTQRGRWTVSRLPPNRGTQRDFPGFHGIVLTGPGPSSRNFRQVADSRIFSGESFWRELPRVNQLLAGSDKSIVVIGGGGTAAAISGRSFLAYPVPP